MRCFVLRKIVSSVCIPSGSKSLFCKKIPQQVIQNTSIKRAKIIRRAE